MDVTDPDAFLELLNSCRGPVAAYFALPPAVTATACAGLVGKDLPTGTRLVTEKPSGSDETSAHELNTVVAQLAPEDHVHRVDHFLGTTTVFGILGVRFANRLLEPAFTAEQVERVDVFYGEDLGLEGRAGVDMIQSHLLQVLAVLTMDEPTALDEREFLSARVRDRPWARPARRRSSPSNPSRT